MRDKILNNINEIQDLVRRTTVKLKHITKGAVLIDEINFTIANIERAAELLQDVKCKIISDEAVGNMEAPLIEIEHSS